MLDNVLLAFDDVDEVVCLDFCRDAPATLAPYSLRLKIAAAKRRAEDAGRWHYPELENGWR